MSHQTKQICLFIVEGVADETSLALPLQNIFDMYYKQEGIKFQITHGDITSRNGVTGQNIVAKIGECVNLFLKRNHLQKKDICQIVQIVDADGTFIDDYCVVVDERHQFDKYPFYGSCEIFVQNQNQITQIQNRNQQKSQNLERISLLPNVMNIPYTVFYFSCNMDHVMHGNANMNDKDKVSEAESFSDQFCDDSIGFIKFIAHVYPSGIDVNARASWEYIKTESNSLKKCSNFRLFLDEATRISNCDI